MSKVRFLGIAIEDTMAGDLVEIFLDTHDGMMTVMRARVEDDKGKDAAANEPPPDCL